MSELKLANYAVTKTVGRHYLNEPDKHRSDFRRDIGRVLYSKAFRRLAFKTQVFSPSEGDHYRNRLTHTLETAQIARVAAMSLNLNSDLAEVIALAHDLGHPPFGHQGEDVLDKLMKDYGGFDHNLQNLRIVTHTEVKSSEFEGLDLTYETLFGIAKGQGAKNYLKNLYDDAPDDIFSAEAKVADLADDLAYTATDFDDYARYHQLTITELHALDLELIELCLPKDVSDVNIAVSMCVRNLVSKLVTDLIENSSKSINQIGGDKAECSEVIGVIALSNDCKRQYQELSGFLRKYMYLNANLKERTLKGAILLEKLFYHKAKELQLSKDNKKGYMELCDKIAGMTDRYSMKQAGLIDE